MNSSHRGARPLRGKDRRERPDARAALALHAAAPEEGDQFAPAGSGSAVGWLTPLVGREVELAEIARLLEGTRLLTLTGAGGVGKTRLALELTRRWSAEESHEHVFVELAPLEASDGESSRLEPVASAIWRTVAGAKPMGVQSVGAPLDAVTRHFGDRRALLVLDNCEHLAVAAPASELLLRRCAGLRVLATSRRPLDLAGETVCGVPPLSVPAADAADALAATLGSEAGRLFVQRAQRSLPSFSLTPLSAPAVAEICRRLDGLPLAIELAAARVRIMSPRQILDGLADRFRLLSAGSASTLGRHQTLKASLEWSYQLMDENARVLLRALGASYEWPLDAIEAIWTTDDLLLDALTSLVDAGLLITVDDGDTRRYRLLESVRSYALERLRAAGEENRVRSAHLKHFRTLAVSADRLLEDDAGRRRLELEARSLHDAFEFAVLDEPILALEMAADLRHWLLVAGNHGDARALCARALEAAPDADPVARAHVLFTAALLAVFDADYPRTRAYAEEAMPLAHASADDGAIGVGLMLASVAKRPLDPNESAQLGRRAVELLRGAGDRQDLALAVAQLAMTEALRDRFDAVRGACDEFASLTQGQRPSWLAVWLEIALAWADLAQGDPRSALVHSERGLELEDDRPTLGHFIALSHKLHAMVLIGDAGPARAVGVAAIEQAQRAGLGVAVATVESVVGLAELALDELASARARALERFSDSHFAGAADSHELLARVELAEGGAGALGRHAAALRSTGQHAGNPRLLAIANWADGAAALHAGKLIEAGNRLHEALALQIEHQLRPDAIDTLEALAELQIAGGRAAPGARLLGAAQRAREELELRRLPARKAHFAEFRARGEELAGSERWTAASEDGLSLTLDAAFDYARRGRGQHVSSATGLASLTPTERSVAEAAAEGLTNAAIAARLLMSHGTVKAHLAHAYSKLGVANRLQLATLVQEGSVRPSV
ncbi:MAG: helix-turn-helix transcriptional regulator [Solirubrobacteraceae bacterium]